MIFFTVKLSSRVKFLTIAGGAVPHRVRVLPGGLADRADVVVEDGAEDPALPVLEDVAVVDSWKLTIVLAEDAVPHSGATHSPARPFAAAVVVAVVVVVDDAQRCVSAVSKEFLVAVQPLFLSVTYFCSSLTLDSKGRFRSWP